MKSIKEAQDRIENLEYNLKFAKEESSSSLSRRINAEKERDETRKQFADLKERLLTAEMENQRLRGYIQRVQEDDTVREELVLVGDPNGGQQQVPKRKSTVFYSPINVTNFSSENESPYSSIHGERKMKNWVSY